MTNEQQTQIAKRIANGEVVMGAYVRGTGKVIHEMPIELNSDGTLKGAIRTHYGQIQAKDMTLVGTIEDGIKQELIAKKAATAEQIAKWASQLTWYEKQIPTIKSYTIRSKFEKSAKLLKKKLGLV
jgi:hypothetical protein